MVQVRVAGVARDDGGQHVLLLAPIGGETPSSRVLPIWIGEMETTSILVAVEGTAMPRPLTHDLMASVLGAVDVTIELVEVTRIEQGTFYAEITLGTAAGRRVIDARPSDAIALACRTGAEMRVADDVLETAGVSSELLNEAPAAEPNVEEFRRFIDEVDPEDFQE